MPIMYKLHQRGGPLMSITREYKMHRKRTDSRLDGLNPLTQSVQNYLSASSTVPSYPERINRQAAQLLIVGHVATSLHDTNQSNWT